MKKMLLFAVCACVLSFSLGYQCHKVEMERMLDDADEYICPGEASIDSLSDNIVNKDINCYHEYKISMFTQRKYYELENLGMALYCAEKFGDKEACCDVYEYTKDWFGQDDQTFADDSTNISMRNLALYYLKKSRFRLNEGK